jgi:hypothetical protein
MRCAAVYAGSCLIPHTFLHSQDLAVRLRHTCHCETSVHCCCNSVISMQCIAGTTCLLLSCVPWCMPVRCQHVWLYIPATHTLFVVMLSASHRLRSQDECRYKFKPASLTFVSSSSAPRITYTKTCMPIRSGGHTCITLIHLCHKSPGIMV